MIIKISSSQTKKYLAYLSNQYVVKTNGSVKVFIGITPKAELSLRRPQYVEESEKII